MPVPELMTWVAAQSRWTRMYRGKRYYVSCRQLHTPPRKEASLQAANAWWRVKQAEIDGASQPTPPAPQERILAHLLGLAETRPAVADLLQIQANLHPDLEGAEHLHYKRVDLIAQAVAALLAPLIHPQSGGLPSEQLTQLAPDQRTALQTALATFRGEEAPPAATALKEHAEAWLAQRTAEAHAGQISLARVANLRIYLGNFLTWLGVSTDVKSLDAGRLSSFYTYCLQQITSEAWSVLFARDVFNTARQWISWLVQSDLLETAPKNLATRFRFGVTAKSIATWSLAEIEEALRLATDKMKLALLLQLNCGMTQIDVADLLDEEVDWSRGVITRQRSKTRQHENVPTVSYALWPPTFVLLQKYRSGDKLVLLTQNGLPYRRETLLPNGTLRKADGIASAYEGFSKKLSFRKPMKLLRKTSASLLGSHPVYGRFVQQFLGHAPTSIADRHYVAPSQALFDEAINWLGRSLQILSP